MNKSKSIDPVNALPRETFCGLFKNHLPLSSTATSSAVSRNWRQVLLSDPTLYHEVDTSKFSQLSNWDPNEEIVPLLYHLNRYMALSRNRLAICTLRLDAFLREMVESYSIKKRRANGFDSLLLALSNSRESLREITLKADQGPGIQDSSTFRPKEVFSMVSTLLDLLASFPVLKKIHMEVPSPISFKIGNGSPTSKTISILNTDPDFKMDKYDWDISGRRDQEEERQVREEHHSIQLMKKAMDFAGEEFEEFGLLKGVDHLSSDDRVEILGMLNQSRQTLHKLEFDIEGWHKLRFDEVDPIKRRYIQFALTCPYLRKLIIMSFMASKELKTGETQPSASSSSTVVSAKFKINHDPVDWDYWCNWVGTSLEKLEMIISDHNLSTSGCFGMISSSIQSLKTLHLSLDPNMVEQDDAFDQNLSFPNVETLSLQGLNFSTSKLFSEARFPSLDSLFIFDHQDSANSFNCLLRLLRKYDKQLLVLGLGFQFSRHVPFIRPSSSIKLNFPSLQHLDFSDYCDEGVIKWLRQFPSPIIESEEEQEYSEEEQEYSEEEQEHSEEEQE